MRGEHKNATPMDSFGEGSSPHARGTHVGRGAWSDQDGIIPACAGNTSPSQAKAWTPRDHPRMRGEHTPNPQSTPNSAGSSPHARGTRLRKKSPKRSGGIIPACAGNTCDFCLMLASRGDHPRMRGEHPPPVSSTTANSGSSPHARGTLRCHYSLASVSGIIPACAGNTPARSTFGSAIWDHPRMRGEHAWSVFVLTTYPGSSPHARGTPAVASGSPASSGIIPACAGNTCLRCRPRPR